MKVRLFLVSSLVSLFVLLAPRSIYAIETPNFPTCSNPQGSLRVSYDSGVHGIVGDTTEHQGSDKVYDLPDSNLMQCFCSTDGSGIQTNWWKDSSLAEEQIDSLKNLGWYYVPTGAVWGLEDTAYMAKNSEYICATNSTTTSNSSSSPDSGSSSGGSSSGTGGAVLGLATTGNIANLYLSLIAGLSFILLGVLLRKRSSS